MKLPVHQVGLCLLVGALSWMSTPAHSQCLPLHVPTNNLAGGQLTPQTLSASLPASEWEMHKPPTGSVYWTYTSTPEAAAQSGTPDTRVELRRSNQQTQYDVVFKTAHKGCLSDLRAELRRAKLKAEPVTCVQCQAERFSAPGYTVTIYNQQESFSQGKAPYPFVLVVHSLAGETSTPSAN